MKIFHIAYFGTKGIVTGLVESVMNLVKHQIELGNDVKIFIPFKHPLADDQTVIFIKSFTFMAKILKNEHPDIVIFDGMYDKYQIRVSYFLKILKIPYVIVFHGGASEDNAKKHWLKKKVANLFFFIRFVHWAQKVVYLSEDEKCKSIFKKANSNDCIIPNGVNIPHRIEMKPSIGRLRILYLSRLDWYGKGLDVLCDAMKLLYDAGYHSKVEFIFCGKKESEKCEQLFQFDDMSIYKGYVAGEEKEKAFRDCDIFILPSRSEGMPIAVLEALSYGKPCIVTPETNMATLIKDNRCGWVIRLSPKDIFGVIINVLNTYNSNREVLYSQCLKAAKMFDWREVAKKSIIEYKKVINSNGKG